MKHLEQKLQIAVVHYLRQLQNFGADFMLFHCPNGGKRDKREAAKFKAMGTLAGVYDLTFIGKDKIIFIEMKAGKGKLTDSQIAFKEKVEGYGFKCYEVSAITESEAIIKVTNILKQNKFNLGMVRI